ncbi:MAG: hypothetical protein QOG17_1850 [Gammaproteobacteria bacterium]|nr:hypothetical protein [Gammaproteobacteria bacterium]
MNSISVYGQTGVIGAAAKRVVEAIFHEAAVRIEIVNLFNHACVGCRAL